MKRVILAAGLLIGASAVAGAQTHPGKTQGKATKYNSTSSHNAKASDVVNAKKENRAVQAPSIVNSSLVDPATLDPAKMYLWEDGQVATPSGHEAGAINSNKLAGNKKGKNTVQNGEIVSPSVVNPYTLTPGKMYMWPDGQAATPTGHEAAAMNGGYAALGEATRSKKQ
jgi:hypothetical protein